MSAAMDLWNLRNIVAQRYPEHARRHGLANDREYTLRWRGVVTDGPDCYLFAIMDHPRQRAQVDRALADLRVELEGLGYGFEHVPHHRVWGAVDRVVRWPAKACHKEECDHG